MEPAGSGGGDGDKDDGENRQVMTVTHPRSFNAHSRTEVLCGNETLAWKLACVSFWVRGCVSGLYPFIGR